MYIIYIYASISIHRHMYIAHILLYLVTIHDQAKWEVLYFFDRRGGGGGALHQLDGKPRA